MDISGLCVWMVVCLQEVCRKGKIESRIDYNHNQGIKDTPPIKFEDRD